MDQRQLKRSRFVGFMKTALPLAALVLVGLIIAWPQLYPRYAGIGLSFKNVEVSERQLRMANPRYQGTDGHGRPYLVTADAAIQDMRERQVVTLENIHGDMQIGDGLSAALTAKRGVYHEETKRLELSGDVSVFADNGYEFHSAAADCDLRSGEIAGDTMVQGQGPYGLLSANAYWLADKGNHMRFTKGVKVTLFPASDG